MNMLDDINATVRGAALDIGAKLDAAELSASFAPGPAIRMQMHGCDVEMAILALWSVKSMRRIAAIASRFGTPSIETMAAELTRLRAISAPPRTGMRA
jgi:hypothetical protein